MLNILALSTTITIDIMQLLLGILVGVGIVFGIYVIILVARLAGTLKKVNKLVGEIDEPITQTVAQLPDLLKKLDGVAEDVSVLTDSAKDSVPAVLDDVQTMTGTVRSGVEAVGGAAKAVGEGFAAFFGARKKEPRAEGINLGNLLDIIAQVMTFVHLFAGRRGSKKSRAKRRR